MKRKVLYVPPVLTAVISLFILCLMLVSCDSSFQGGAGGSSKTSVTINLSGGNSRNSVPWPPQEHGILEQLDYIITFSRYGETLHFDAHGGSNIKINAEAGRWEIKVEAYYQRMLYAAGITNAEIVAGQNNSVTISMKKAFDDDLDGDGDDFVFVTGLTLDLDNITLMRGKSETVFATVYPVDAFNKGVTWSSDNPNVRVSDGLISPMSTGTAVITATTDDGGFNAEVRVTVVSTPDEKDFGVGVTPVRIECADISALQMQWDSQIMMNPGNYIVNLQSFQGSGGGGDTGTPPPPQLALVITVPRGVTVSIRGSGARIESPFIMINISEGAKLILRDITLESTDNTNIMVFGGTLVMEEGSVLNAGSSGSLVQVFNGSFIMNGGRIDATQALGGFEPVIRIDPNGHFEKNTGAVINGRSNLVAVGQLYRDTYISEDEILRYRVRQDGTVIQTGNWMGTIDEKPRDTGDPFYPGERDPTYP